MEYVIIGNSAAAVGCIEGIRQLDQKGPITVVSDEPYHTYSRPLISYLMSGKTDLARMKYRPDGFYQEHGVQPVLGRRVMAIDPAAQRIELSDGRHLDYGRLLVATGSRPFVPPMEGLDGVACQFSFLSLDDERALEAALTPKSRVLIVGAGLIGLKCAEGLAGRVAEIQVVDLAGRVLSSILDERGAQRVQHHIEAQGIRFFLGDSVERFEGNAARLKSGTRLDFDVLVLAVGVRPNVELVAQAGGRVSRGILTDAHCATSLPGVYAAGDCATSHDITTGTDRVLALLPNAYMQGECAGINMAGGQARFDKAMPMNAIGFFGLHLVTAGSYEGKEYVTESRDAYKKLVTGEGRLKGFILLGDVRRAGIYTALIRERTPLNSIDFDLIREKPQLMAFSRKERARQLGGMDA